ncbi:MAG: HEAT repeat domain-containing protein [Phycisphaerae bacterium]
MSSLLAEYAAKLERDHAVPNYIEPTIVLVDRKGADGQIALRPFEWLIRQFADGIARTWLVVAPSGAGKTSLTWHAAIQACYADQCPVFVNPLTLQLCWEDGIRPAEFVLQAKPSHFPQDDWRQIVEDNRLVLIIDAVNELQRTVSEGQWDFLLRLLAGGHPTPVLATSRYAVDPLQTPGQGLRDVETLDLDELTEDQILAYLARRGLSDGDEHLRAFRAAGIELAARNPYLLKLLTDLLQYQLEGSQTREIPRTRAELLLATVLRPIREHRLKPAEVDLANTGLSMEAVLTAAATTLYASGGQQARLADVRDALVRVWPDREAVEQAIVAFFDTQMADLAEDSGGDKVFRLTHDSLRDFGLALGWREASPPDFVFHPGHLNQCFADWVGMPPRAGSDGDSDADELALTYLNELARLGSWEIMSDVLGANRGRLSEQTRSEYWEAIGEALRDVESEAAGSMADQLTRLPKAVLFEAAHHGILRPLRLRLSRLIKGRIRRPAQNEPTVSKDRLLRDVYVRFVTRRLDSRGLQRAAREARGEKSFARPRWWRHAADEPRPFVRPDAAEIHHLIDTLGDPRRLDRDRGFASQRLGLIGDPIAVPVLCQVLRECVEPVHRRLRGSCANSLGLIGDESAVEDLVAAMKGDADPVVRGSCTNALGLIGDRAAARALMETLLRDDDPVNRGAAAKALGLIGDKVAVEDLTSALKQDDDPMNRGAAANALGLIGDKAAVEDLCEVLRDDQARPDVRGSCANALGLIGEKATVAELCKVLRDDRVRPDVPASCANALGLIGDRVAVPDLCVVLRNDRVRPDVRGSCANALGLIGDGVAMPDLCVVLRDDQARSDIRGSCANSLGLIGDRAAVPDLCVVLRDDQARSDIRGSCANALGLIGDKVAVPDLCGVLRDEQAKSDIRGSCANALGLIGDKAAVRDLCEVLRDKGRPPDVRGSCASALGLIGDRAAAQDLTETLKEDPNPAVRGSCANALRRLGVGATTSESRIEQAQNRQTDRLERDVAVLLDSASDPNDVEHVFRRLARLPADQLTNVAQSVDANLAAVQPDDAALAERHRALRELAERVRRAQAEADELREHPERILTHYVKRVRPLFPVPQPASLATPAPVATDVARAPEGLAAAIEYAGRLPAASAAAPPSDAEMLAEIEGLVKKCAELGWPVSFGRDKFMAPRQRKRRAAEILLLRYAFARHQARLRRFFEIRRDQLNVSVADYREFTATFGINALHRELPVGKGTIYKLQVYAILKSFLPTEAQLNPVKAERTNVVQPTSDAEMEASEPARSGQPAVDPREEAEVFRQLDELADFMLPGLPAQIRKMYEAGDEAMTLENVKQYVRDARRGKPRS